MGVFGCVLGAFWMAFGPLDAPGVHFCEFVNFSDFGNVWATKKSSNLDTKSFLLVTFWWSVFCCVFGCAIFSHFAVLGFIQGPIWEAFWGAWEPWK